MENQHRRITGYRELTQEEIDLMNEIKTLGLQIEPVLIRVREHIMKQRNAAYMNPDENTQVRRDARDRLDQADPEKWIQLGTDSIQTGLMYATRAVAQPTFF